MVQRPDGEPVSGLAWELIHPDGKTKEKGTLGSDGAVHKDGVKEGAYTLILKEVEHATWRSTELRPGEPARLAARVWGFAAGTAAKIRLFRELEETDTVRDPGDAEILGVDRRATLNDALDDMLTSSHGATVVTGRREEFVGVVDFASVTRQIQLLQEAAEQDGASA